MRDLYGATGHAIARARERYGLRLTPADLRAIAVQCHEGNGRLTVLPNGTERHLIVYHQKTLVVAYKPRLDPPNLASEYYSPGIIITVLPPEAASQRDDYSLSTRAKSVWGDGRVTDLQGSEGNL